MNAAAAPVAAEAPQKIKHARLKGDHIEIDEKIQFAVNADTILSSSDSLLGEIVDTIKENPQIKKIEVQGHASSEGDPGRNKTLSDLRAKAVVAALVGRGVDAKILTAKGFGSSKPVADNNSEDGREKNRRVEFVILDPASKDAAAAPASANKQKAAGPNDTRTP
ncbi:Outer membrane fibronectin-binding protein [Labilithrix luteola]|uniref:Outer membrane fibronectin-binding protein n=1 Tax=Labilithrix luteola TaxID=1391654 RepID=A0A0K1Q1F9_9BACT|nr:Outer membrane fibronectin-binding protein [Labilithrix luteola]